MTQAAAICGPDEANSVIMARQGPGELLARLKLDSNPPLYYLILHAWMGAFGASETAVRGLSIVGSVALVASVFLIGRRLFGTETAAIAALLLAVSPIQVFYSQQARMYTLLSVAALLSSYFLWRAIADGRPRFVVACGPEHAYRAVFAQLRPVSAAGPRSRVAMVRRVTEEPPGHGCYAVPPSPWATSRGCRCFWPSSATRPNTVGTSRFGTSSGRAALCFKRSIRSPRAGNSRFTSPSAD